MAWPRRSALIRLPTLLLLVWVAFDIGAHGLIASDFEPLSVPGSSSSIGTDTTGTVARHVGHDHCFCHGISIGAVLPALPVALAPSGDVVVPFSSRVPCGDHHAVDHPPQLAL